MTSVAPPGYSSRVEVIAPEALRDKVIEMAQRVIAFYAQPARADRTVRSRSQKV